VLTNPKRKLYSKEGTVKGFRVKYNQESFLGDRTKNPQSQMEIYNELTRSGGRLGGNGGTGVNPGWDQRQKSWGWPTLSREIVYEAGVVQKRKV